MTCLTKDSLEGETDVGADYLLSHLTSVSHERLQRYPWHSRHPQQAGEA